MATIITGASTAFAEQVSEEKGGKLITIVTERTYVYTAEAVFGAWVAEESLVAPVTKIEKDVRIGGHYRLFVEIENMTAVMEAVYRVIEPNRKLVYSWEWNDDGEETVVSVNFIPKEDGCLVRLTHGEFQKQESYDRHAFGWENYFNGLEKQLSGKH